MNQREIKFRAWDKTHNEMFFINDIWRIKPSKLVENMKDGYGVMMQFTGLKDKNGKEIYEGDIVKFNKQGKEVIAAVEYHEKAASFTPSARAKKRGSYREFEIIGNIYENPELLK